MTWKTALILLSIVCFALAAFRWTPFDADFTALGLLLFVATFVNITSSTPKQ
jgi:hypothetical protein